MNMPGEKAKKGDQAALGIFENRANLENAVGRLKSQGFRNSDISVLMPSKEASQDFAHEHATKAPEGAATGAGSGILVGGILGWLAGIGSLAIPGIGPFVAAGPIMAALGGAGIGGAVGGITGALIGVGIPEYEAKVYEQAIQSGGMLLAVHVDNKEWADKAKDILKETGAKAISLQDEKKADKRHAESKARLEDETPFNAEPAGFATGMIPPEGSQQPKLVDKLKEILRGERAAAETYQQVLDSAGADPRASELRTIQSEHEEAIQTLSQTIERIGGTADHTSGTWGSWAKTVVGTAKIFGDRAALKALKEGEEHGLKQYEELAGEEKALDPQILTHVRSKYIPRQQAHIVVIDQLMQKVA